MHFEHVDWDWVITVLLLLDDNVVEDELQPQQLYLLPQVEQQVLVDDVAVDE